MLELCFSCLLLAYFYSLASDQYELPICSYLMSYLHVVATMYLSYYLLFGIHYHLEFSPFQSQLSIFHTLPFSSSLGMGTKKGKEKATDKTPARKGTKRSPTKAPPSTSVSWSNPSTCTSQHAPRTVQSLSVGRLIPTSVGQLPSFQHQYSIFFVCPLFHLHF